MLPLETDCQSASLAAEKRKEQAVRRHIAHANELQR